MVSIEEALEIVYSQQVNRKTTERPLSNTLGYCLSAKVTAPFDLPSFDNSAMDGFAVCGVSDSYQVVGEVAAGNTAPGGLSEGEAMRIFTGGKVPQNTTSVIMQEKTRLEGDTVLVEQPVEEGQNIRRQGEELHQGQVVFEEGHKIMPATLGLVGSLGIEELPVYQKPDVKIIVTGNELLELGEERSEGQIYESNSFALTGALEQYGYSCQEKQQIADDFDLIKNGIRQQLESSDLLILSGGISVGDYDYVKRALQENGVQELFYKVYQKPGKPLFFGRKEDTFVFALPGNPASSLTCFYLYVLPLLNKISGAKTLDLQRVSVPLSHDFNMPSKRPTFLKAIIEQQQVSILNNQGSSMIHSMALGNALAYIGEPSKLRAGDLVECILI